MRNRLLALLCAAFLGALTLYGVGVLSTDAHAQTLAPDDVLSPEESYRVKKFLQSTKPSDFGTPGRVPTSSATSAARQKVVTSSARKVAPNLSRHVVTKGGLAGVAAGIWIHNGITIYNAQKCGDTTCPALAFDAEFRQAEAGFAGAGAGGAFAYMEDASGARKSELVIYKMEYKVVNGQCTWSTSFGGRNAASPTGTYGTAGWTLTYQPAGGGISSQCQTIDYNFSGGTANPFSYSIKEVTDGNVRYRFKTKTYDSSTGWREEPFGEEFTTGQSYTWESPVYDWGATAPVETPPANSYGMNATESNALYNDIRNQTCTPEAPPTEVCPDYFPQEWEEEFPDDPNKTPEQEPYADPDKDGQPNHADPDDDDDGIPDEQDPEFTPLPITAPNADPDGDQIPNKDDPDDDGDGIPDEADPNPTTPTTPQELPSDHPYADPDGDQVPNKDDGDDDNDTIPDPEDPNPTTPTTPQELPPDHPYADPDGDGVPNKDDDDDDGDGTPDPADPAPTNPNETGDLDKDGIPDTGDGDQDGDGVPDWEDIEPRNPASPNRAPNLDGDGVPDWSDPWPGNPYAPADPTIDGDLDDVPDYKDPVINDPNVPTQPWPPGSPGDVPTNPGQPNIPTNPTNPNYPTNPTKPAQPSDPTSPINPTAPINPNEPMPPGEAGGPPPPDETATSCPIPRKPVVSIPNIKVGSVFPFSLVVWAFDAIAALHGPSSYPKFDMPILGTVDFAVMSTMFSVVRAVTTALLMIGLVAGWYTYIRGSEA